MIKKFKKKPVVVEAVQYTGEITEEIKNFCPDLVFNPTTGEIAIKTLEGEMIVSNGDWIIQGVKGEFYPCKSDVFEMIYEEVEQE